MGRGRKKANTLAAELLLQENIKDEDVLSVLELWYFSKNTSRVNVLPRGEPLGSTSPPVAAPCPPR